MAAVVPCRPRFEVAREDALRSARRNTAFRVKYVGADLAVERFLRALAEYRDSLRQDGRDHHGWLLPMRQEFRLIIHRRPCLGLRDFLGVCPPNHPTFPIAVWLLGVCATRYKNFDLDRLPDGNSPRARKHLARALRRVESWPRLRELAAEYPDDELLQRLLADDSMRNFRRRLSRFAQNVDHSHEAEAALVSRMPLWIRDTNWKGKPPKRASWIRIVLERIREWVRGE